MEFLSDLNESQRKAVEHVDGPSIVIAGAGSGKTRVLTYRIAYIIGNGADPFNILSLTFTNKAAKEMKNRIGSIVGENQARALWMGTFHSVFARILRIEHDKLGYPSNFTIYDTDDSKSLIRQIVKGMKLDDKVYKANGVLSRISSAKNNLYNAAAYNNDAVLTSEDVNSKRPFLGKIFEQYEQRCFRAGAMDFDDLLYNTNMLLKNHPDVLFKYQDKFRYILVDEFQDTNFSQYNIIKMLGARYENVCVVGDDAQSIYAFRGATIHNILNFHKEYPDAVTFKLEQNYRSTQNIVDAANSIIAKNRDQLKKNVWTDNGQGNKISVTEALTDGEEAMSVANKIFDIQHNENVIFEKFAILYRTNAQSRSMEEAMRKMSIPYKIYGGLSFYQRKEIKDLLSYFRLIVNPADDEALRRIINYPARGIGQTTMAKLGDIANNENETLWQTITNPAKIQGSFNKGTLTKIAGFAQMVRGFQNQLDKKDAYEIGKEVAFSAGLMKELKADESPEAISRLENIEELLNGMKEFAVANPDEADQDMSLGGFLQEVALLTDTDKTDDDTEGQDFVTLMTIHASKGLEFPYLFVVGIEEGLFPNQMAVNTRADLEEERRLFYVAVTRAERQLYLSYARSRYKFGQLTYSEPSRFLDDIDDQFIEFSSTARESVMTNTSGPSVPGITPRRLRRVTDAPKPVAGIDLNFVADDTSGLQAGMQVKHQRFGLGKVINVTNDGGQRKATVFFNGVGNKQLLLKFAKLQIV